MDGEDTDRGYDEQNGEKYDSIADSTAQRTYGTFNTEENRDDDNDFYSDTTPRRQYGTFINEEVWRQPIPTHRQVNELQLRRVRSDEALNADEMELYNTGEDRNVGHITTHWQRAPLNENTVLTGEADPQSPHFRVSPWRENMPNPSDDSLIPGWLYSGQQSGQQFLPENDLRILESFGYTFGRQLGFGGFGTIVECYYKPQTGDQITLVCKKVIVKIAAPVVYDNQTRLEMFNTEKLAILTAKHENVIDVQNVWTNYDTFYSEDVPYALFFMEKADGDLWSYIDRTEMISQRPLPEYYLRLWFKQILFGVEYLHSVSIAHRDLKPENVLYVRKPTPFPFVVKLCDFGLAHIAVPNDPQSRLSTADYGTVGYRAPEVANAGPLRRYNVYLADVFSLGMTLYWMTTVEQKYPLTNFSVELDNLIHDMAEDDPTRRMRLQQVRYSDWMLLRLTP